MAKKTIQRTDDPNNLLARAYSLNSVEEALILYQDWAVSYDRHLEGQLKYIAPLTIVNIFSDRLNTIFKPQYLVERLDSLASYIGASNDIAEKLT